jgi:hypothetical protein
MQASEHIAIRRASGLGGLAMSRDENNAKAEGDDNPDCTMRESIARARASGNAASIFLGGMGGSRSRLHDSDPQMKFLAKLPFLQRISRERRTALAQHLSYKHETYGTVLQREGSSVAEV